VQALSRGLRELGLVAGEKVAILAETRLEWALTDYACLCARTPTCRSIDPPANQVEYILRDAGAAAVVCSTAAQVEKIQAVKAVAVAPPRDRVRWWRGGRGGHTRRAGGRGRAAAAKYPASKRKRSPSGRRPRDPALHSGTTGQPKGVMLTHDNICSNVRGSVETLRVSESDSCLAPAAAVAHPRADGGVLLPARGRDDHYAESIDAFAQNLQEVRPTIVAAVPRVYEKVYARVLENAHTGGA